MKVRYLFSLVLVSLLVLFFSLFDFQFSTCKVTLLCAPTATGEDPATGSESIPSASPEQTLDLSNKQNAGSVRFDPDKWPVDTGAAVNSSPALGDLDGDGFLEVIVGSDSNKVYAWKADGTLLPGWPVSSGDSIRSSPALADLNGDGKLDVVVGSFDGKMYAWDFRGNVLKGWPATTGSVIYSSPAIGDVDGDQLLEVVAGSFDNKVYVWNADGTLLRGWPQSTGLFVYSSPALADLDGDGIPEIIVGSDDNRVFVWNGAGETLNGWPQVTGHVVPTSPAVGDIDGDGDLDIIVGSWDKVYAWNSRGRLKPGWPITVGNWVTSSPALADLNNDGLPDVIIGSKDGRVHAWNGQGENIDGWPTITDGEVSSSPVVGDVDGDGRLDVVVGSKDTRLYIWDVNGKLLPGWPKATGDGISSSPAIGDLDKDGHIEVVVGSKDGKVYIWSIPNSGQAQGPPDIPWAGFHRNPQRTGFYDGGLFPLVRRQLPAEEGVADRVPLQEEVTGTKPRTMGQEPAIKRVEPEKPRMAGKEIIDDLTLSSFTDTTATLTWTAPVIKGNPAKFYDIRFSPEPITEETWDKATKYTTDLRPNLPNQKETFTLLNLPFREKLYIALRASDGRERTQLSNVVELDRLDNIPPAAIKDLVAIEKGEQIELSWTAPGDNDEEGTANAYDVRYATKPLDEASWSEATEIIGEPKPLPAGTKQQFLIPKPPLTETLYFGVKTIDEALNFSPLSNIARWTPQDSIPPAKIQDLKVEGVTQEGVTLSWMAPGDDGDIGRAFRYDIRYSESPITEENWSSIKNLVIGPIPEVAGTLQRFQIQESFADKIYYFAMKAVDERGNESPLSNTVQVDARDKIAPAPVKDLKVVEVGADWARITWTATGDDGAEGTASSYSLKYAEDPRVLEDWDQAEEAGTADTPLPKPLPSGSKEEFRLSRLKSNVRYYVALKVLDDQGNTSALSNIVEVKTSDTLSPAPIVDLRVTGSTEDSVTLSWTATGDDGQIDKAAEYDLRYTIQDKLTQDNWDQAIQIGAQGDPPLPQPAEAGQPERYIVRNLSRDTVYYFAIEAIDKQGNRSGLSNVLEVSTADATPPAVVKDLVVLETGADWVRVAWTATGDDGMQGRASFYSLRYAESSQTIRAWDQAIEVPHIIKPGNPEDREEFLIAGLKNNTIYYIALKVGDDRGNLSELSNVIQARTTDTISPAPIADLKVTSTAEDSVVLSWTATGDDGRTGRAATYDLRFTVGEKLTVENWPLARKVPYLPKPAESGSVETFSITGLSRGTPYYFAIEAIDGEGNRSGLSNVAEIATKDTTPPAPIKDLTVVNVTSDSVELTWTATGDDESEGRASTYALKYALDRNTLEAWNQATEAYPVPTPAEAYKKETFTLTGLKGNTAYYIGLKAIDDAGNTSGLSNIVQIKTSDITHPAPILDLRAVASTEDSVTLSWTATGDDGRIGKAASYDLRYVVKSRSEDRDLRSSIFDPQSWSQAIQVRGLPQPAESGETETFTIAGLSRDSTYYFAIEATDAQENRSGLSNVLEVSTTDTTPPASVQTLEVLGAGEDWIRVTWQATGDDDMEGKATSYSLRYAETAEAIREWDRATEVINVIRPGNPGEKEEFIISGLKNNTTYYIGLKVRDDRGNTSELSNIVQARTRDTAGPAPIVDLRVVRSTENSITLSWTATGDDGQTGQASAYDLRYTVGEELTRTSWNLAQRPNPGGVTPSLQQPKPSGSTETYTITSLSRDTSYYFGVEVLDRQGNRSGISNIVEAHTQDLTPPANVVDLAGVGVGADWVKVSWTATGDDGTQGRATAYSLRYTSDLKVLEQWDQAPSAGSGQALEAPDVPKPSPSGTKEEFTLTGLKNNSTYYIALKVMDNRQNLSPLSNVLKVQTADTINPAPITDLRVVQRLESEVPGMEVDTITLAWTATGDDDRIGRAARYDLRYSTTTLTEDTWASAQKVPNVPAPAEAGTPEKFRVRGLTPNQTYYFALTVIDKNGNASLMSNVVAASTADTIPPKAVSDLLVEATSDNSVSLTWTAVGDDSIHETAAAYDLRYSITPITEANWTQATRVRQVKAPSEPGTKEKHVVTNLLRGTLYYFAVKSIDRALNVSPLSNVVQAYTLPNRITDLIVSGFDGNDVILAWTAPGGDLTGRSGTARAERFYEIRYAKEEITADNWSQATLYPGRMKAKAPGSQEQITLTELPPDEKLFFAIRISHAGISDGGVSASPISDSLEVNRADIIPPAAVTDLTVIEVACQTSSSKGEATGSSSLEKQIEIPEAEASDARKKQKGFVKRLFPFLDGKSDDKPESSIRVVRPESTSEQPTTRNRCLELSWRAVGDNGNEGVALAYDIRYAFSPLNETNWAGARQYTNEPIPQLTGTIESFVVPLPSQEETVFFALKVLDEALNISPISNVATWTPADQIPPAAITDLRVTYVDSLSATLAWTAPGDNGNKGRAAFYDLRYSTSKSTFEAGASDAGWSNAQTVVGEPLPEVAGTPQSMTLTNLAHDTTYYFALTTTDDAKNTSPLSNVVEVTTPDLIAPAPVKDLSIVGVDLDRLKLRWTASGDDEYIGQASQYSLKYATDREILEDWDFAIEAPDLPKPKSAGKKEEFVLTGLTHNTTYYIGIKVIDNRGNYSGLSNILEARTGDAITPQTIADLKVVGSERGTGEKGDSLTLAWTAPGDDGMQGHADKYEVRYSTRSLDETSWNKWTKVKEVPKPAVAGTVENLIIRGLSPNQKYYFGVIAIDKEGNTSPVSNIAEGFTTDTIPPRAIGDLQVEDISKDSVTLLWTSSGDDALHDQAFVYDLRYSTLPLDEVNWEQAEKVQGIPQPGKVGILERFTVLSLQENTPYYFAIKVIDLAGNVSSLSNIASTQTKDVTPPVSTNDLVATFPTRNTVTLVWTAPQDPNTGGTVAVYDIRYWEVREERPKMGDIRSETEDRNPQQASSLEPQSSEEQETSKNGVQTENKKQSTRKTGHKNTQKDTELTQIKPLKPQDLPVAKPKVEENPGPEKLKDATRSIFPWEEAFKITTPPRPATPGSVEKYVVANLKEGQTYAFAIRSLDQSGNISELSNIAVEMTLGQGEDSKRPERPVPGSSQGWSVYQGKGAITPMDGTGIQVTSRDTVFGFRQPLVVSYPDDRNTLALPQDRLSLKIKSREAFIIYAKVLSTQQDEYYLAYQASIENGRRMADGEQLQQTLDNGQQTKSDEPQALAPGLQIPYRVDSFIFFQLDSQLLDGNWQHVERNLREDLFNATGQNYLETKWLAVRGVDFSLGNVNLTGKLVKAIPIVGTPDASWTIHYGKGDLKAVQDNELNDQVLQIKSLTGRDLVVAYPPKPGIQIAEKFLSTKIKAREEFKLFVKVMTSRGETYYLTYIPRDGNMVVSGNYIYVPLGSNYQDGTWHKLEQNLEADLKKALESYGQSDTNYSYTTWISVSGKEVSLDEIEFSTEEITAQIPK